MIVTLMDGDTLRTSIGNCTGYVAKRIEIEASDIEHMRHMLRDNPQHLNSILAQLEMRFPERRMMPQQQASYDFLTKDAKGNMEVGWWKVFEEGRRKHGKRPELAMGYGMGKTRALNEIADAYEALGHKVYRFPSHAVYPKTAPVFGPCKPDRALIRWFWFWFAFFFILFS